MKKFKQNPYIFPIIGGFLTIIALFTPTSFHTEPGNTYYVWMSQIYLETDPGSFIPGLLRLDLLLLTFSTVFSVIIFSSAMISITISFVYRKRSIAIKEHRKNGIIIAILIALSTFAWIVMMEIFYRLNGYPHWSAGGGPYFPHFGVIGPFLGSAFILIGVLIEEKTKETRE